MNLVPDCLESIIRFIENPSELLAFLALFPTERRGSRLSKLLALSSTIPKEFLWPELNLKANFTQSDLCLVLPLFQLIKAPTILRLKQLDGMTLNRNQSIYLAFELLTYKLQHPLVRQWQPNVGVLQLIIPTLSMPTEHKTHLIAFLQQCGSLYSLSLVWSVQVDILCFNQLIDQVPIPKLRHFTIRSTIAADMPDSIVDSMKTWLFAMENLEVIILDGINMSICAASDMIRTLQKMKLVTLEFYNCPSLISLGLQAEYLPTSMRRVVLENCELRCDVFPAVPSLSDLQLRGRGNISAMAHILSKTTSLSNLKLQFTDLVPASQWTNMIPAMTKLQALDIQLGHNMGDYGVQLITNILPNCTVLYSLVLSNNEITDIGATLLAGSLNNCPSLKKLFLDYNSIGLNGVVALMKSSLEELSVCHNSATRSDLAQLQDALPLKHSPTKLLLYH